MITDWRKGTILKFVIGNFMENIARALIGDIVNTIMTEEMWNQYAEAIFNEPSEKTTELTENFFNKRFPELKLEDIKIFSYIKSSVSGCSKKEITAFCTIFTALLYNYLTKFMTEKKSAKPNDEKNYFV